MKLPILPLLICLSVVWANLSGAAQAGQPIKAGALALKLHHQENDQGQDKEDKKETQSSEPTAGGNAAPCISWTNPFVKTRAALLCIHGLGLYSGSYKNFGLRMSRHGIATYAIDVRGFGSWMRHKGHEDIDFKACLEDVRTALNSIHQANPGLPVFLLGESMGGAIALRATAMYPELIDGLISSVPAGSRFQQKRTDLVVAMHMLEGPHKDFDVGKRIVDQATGNEALRNEWENNPDDRMDLSPKDLIQFQRFMNENHDSVSNITKTPVLIVQGCRDHLVKPEGTIDLFNELPTADKDLFMFGTAEHLIFEENQDTTDNSRLVMSWISSHIPGDNATAAGDTSPFAEAMTKMINGQYPESRKLLTELVKQHPNNAEGHYWLAVCCLKMNDLPLAKKEFVTAIHLGNGSSHAQQANSMLLNLPANMTAPSIAAGGNNPASSKNAASAPAGSAQSKPSVLIFSSNWCEQCQQIAPTLDKLRTLFADRVDFKKIDIDDPASHALVSQYDVGPIPTVIYLNRQGQVISHSIGSSNLVNFSQAVKGLLEN